MSVISSLKVLLTADTMQFRRSLAQTGAELRRFQKDFESRFKDLGDTFEKMGGTGFGDAFRDVDSGKFIGAADAMQEYHDRVNELGGALDHLRDRLTEVNAPLNQHRSAVELVVRSSALAAQSQMGFATSTAMAARPQAQLTTSLRSMAPVMTQLQRNSRLAADGMAYFGLANYNARDAVQSWNWVGVLRGPGLLTDAMDYLRYRFLGIVPPMRLVQKIVQDLLIPALLAIAEVITSMGAKAGPATQFLGQNLRKLAEELLPVGAAYRKTLGTDLLNAFRVARGASAKFTESAIEDADQVIGAARRMGSALIRVPMAMVNIRGSMDGAGSALRAGAADMARYGAESAKAAAKVALVRGAAAGLAVLTLGPIAGPAVAATAALFGVTKPMKAIATMGQVAAFGVGKLAQSLAGGLVGAARSVLGPIVSLPSKIAKTGMEALRMAGNILTLGLAFRKTKTDADQASSSLGKFGSAANATGKAAQGISFGLSSLGSGASLLTSLGPIAAASFGVVAGAAKGLKEAVNFEQTEIAFTTFLGSVEKAKSTLASLQQFADVTPFDTGEVIQAGKTLLAFGFEAKDLTSTMTYLGDIASGTGTDFGELATLFGQFRAQQKIMTQDLRQLTTRGIPILDVLGKMYGKTAEEVLQMAEDSQISFQMVDAAFKQMTSAGGRFANLSATQSQSVLGLWSTFSSTITNAMRAVGIALINGLNVKGALSGLITIVQWIQTSFVPAIVTGFNAVVGVVGPVLNAFAQLTGYIYSLIAPLAEMVAQWVMANPWLLQVGASIAAVAAAFVIVPALIAGVSTALGVLGAVIGAFMSPVALVIGGIGLLVYWIGSATGLFDDFAGTLQYGIDLTVYAVQHWQDAWQLAAAKIAYWIVAIGNTIAHWFTDVIPAYLIWFSDNWYNLFLDAASGIKAIFTNLGKNIGGLFLALWKTISSGGAVAFKFNWTPLLEGFKATTEALPEIAARQEGALESALRKDAEKASAAYAEGFDAYRDAKQKERELANKPPELPPGADKAAVAAANEPPPPPPEAKKKNKAKSLDESLSADQVGSEGFFKQLVQRQREGAGQTVQDKQLKEQQKQSKILEGIRDGVNGSNTFTEVTIS